MKKNNKGFMLAETLVVSAFVAGVLIFLYIQFTNLNVSYEDSYVYNSTEGLYALDDVKNYIESDLEFIEYLNYNIETTKYIDITDCKLFKSVNYCLKLFEIENIDRIFVTYNFVPIEKINDYDSNFLEYIKTISSEGDEIYRIVASFKNSTYATLRFGE